MHEEKIQREIDNANLGIAEGKPQFVLASARRLRELNRADLAEQILTDAYKGFPDSIEIFRALATAMRERSPEETLRFSEDQSSRWANHARFQKALALDKLGRRSQAIREMEDILSSAPDFRKDRHFVSKLFDLYNDESRFQDAIALLEPLIDSGVFSDVRMKQLLATVLIKHRSSLAKVLQLLREHVDPQSERLKKAAREIMGDIPSFQTDTTEGEKLTGTAVFFAYAILRKSLVLELARHVERQTGVTTILMDEESHEGRSLTEKFEELSSKCGFGVFVLTADDICVSASGAAATQRRVPRQNVVLELGYFLGKLGRRKRIAILVEEGVELPSDVKGLGWIPITGDLAGTKLKLSQELKSAGFMGP